MDMRSTIAPLVDALARGTAAGASAAARRGAKEAAESLDSLARGRPEDCAALVADGRVVPALAAALCSRHADGAVVAEAAYAAASLVANSPAAAKREQQDALVRLGALEAAVQRLSAGGSCVHAAAALVATLVECQRDVAGAAVAAGALPALVALLGDAGNPAAADAAATALFVVAASGGPPIAAAAVEAGAARALVERLGRARLSADSLGAVLKNMVLLAQTPAGAERLVADGALPHVFGLLRSPAPGVADAAVACLAAAYPSQSWGAVAEALLADATSGPALAALLLGRDGDAPFRAACVLRGAMTWAIDSGGRDAWSRAGGLAAAISRAGAVPRLVELLRAACEGERWRPFANHVVGAIVMLGVLNAAAAHEALGAGAWEEGCRMVVEEDARGRRADAELVGLGLWLLAALVTALRDGAPRPAAAERGLAAALARALGRAAAGAPRGGRAASRGGAGVVRVTLGARAAAVLEEALERADGAQHAAEFVDAGGAGHLVGGRRRRGRRGLG
jgi:hypothetical protein